MNLNTEQLNVFKTMYLPDASDRELAQVREVCKAKQLDPFAGDVNFIRKGGKLVDIVTIDAARRRAARTGQFAGVDEAVFDDSHGDLSCKVTIYRLVGGTRCPFTARRFLKETKGNTPNWSKMPRTMLEKCTEAMALRKAFPEYLGDTYEENESLTSETVKTEVPDEPSNEMRWTQVVQAFAVFGIDEVDLLKEVGDKKVADLVEEDFKKLLAWYEQCKSSQKS